MITIYLKQYNKIIRNADTGLFEELGYDDILWIDMLQPTIKEQKAVENFMEINLQTKQQVEEIESTSKYSETENAIISNANFFVPTGESFVIEPVSFIISNEGVLVSVRQAESRTFQETEKRLQINYRNYPTGYHIFITLLEVRIDYDADMVELIARQVSSLSRNINGEDSIDKEVLRRINTLQESTMLLRENIFDRQRVLSGILRSERFPNDIYPRLQLMIKDVNSLINHADFSFQRLDYIQDAALGLINIEQNEIVKIFSVAAVVFMPATLIASIYGMNFFASVVAAVYSEGMARSRLPVCHRLDVALFGAYDLVLPIQEVVIKTVRFDFGFIFVGRGVFYLFRKSFPKPGRNKVRI
jgi:magnesium transporter